MSVCTALLIVDTFKYGRTKFIGEFLKLGEEFLILKYARSHTPRAARTIRKFIKEAGDLANHLRIDFVIDPTVTSLLNIQLVGRKLSLGKSHGYDSRKEAAKIRSI